MKMTSENMHRDDTELLSQYMNLMTTATLSYKGIFDAETLDFSFWLIMGLQRISMN